MLPGKKHIPSAGNTDHPKTWLPDAKHKATRWARLFAVAGAILAGCAAILLATSGQIPGWLEPLIWPAGFILFLADWQGTFGPAVILAIMANAAVWAGIGWFLGYGSSH